MMGAGEAGSLRWPRARIRISFALTAIWRLAESDLYKKFVTVWFGLFCAAFSLLPAEWEQRWIFYLGIPIWLPAVRHGWQSLARGTLVWAVAVFLALTGLSALWSDHWLTVGDEMRRAFWIGYFLLVCCAIGDYGLAYMRGVLGVAALAASVVSTYELARFLTACDGCARFVGLGPNAIATWTAMITGSLALIGMSIALPRPGPLAWAILAGQLPMSALMIATGGRAAFVVYVGTALLGVLLAARHGGRKLAVPAVVTVTLVIALSLGVVGFLGEQWLNTQIARGDSLRFRLWAENLQRIAQRPWYGHGATAHDLVYLNGHEVGNHAHNMLMAQTYYLGIPGGALWLVILLLCLRVGWRAFRENGDLLPVLPLVFLLGVGCVDIGSVVVDVHPEWLFVWVVIGIALAYDTDRRRRPITSR